MPISISGADELIARLEGIGEEMYPAVAEGMGAGLREMQADAKTNCHVDTGALQGSIATEVTEAEGIYGRLYSPLEYAVYVEMGTGIRGEANHVGAAPGATYDPTWPGQPAQPFMYPAFKANRKVVLARISQAIQKRIKGG